MMATICFSRSELSKLVTNPPPDCAAQLYRVKAPAPARTMSVMTDAPMMPNGVTLSPDESTSYVDGTTGLMKFAVDVAGRVASALAATSMFVMNYSGDGDGGRLRRVTCTSLVCSSNVIGVLRQPGAQRSSARSPRMSKRRNHANQRQAFGGADLERCTSDRAGQRAANAVCFRS